MSHLLSPTETDASYTSDLVVAVPNLNKHDQNETCILNCSQCSTEIKLRTETFLIEMKALKEELDLSRSFMAAYDQFYKPTAMNEEMQSIRKQLVNMSTIHYQSLERVRSNAEKMKIQSRNAFDSILAAETNQHRLEKEGLYGRIGITNSYINCLYFDRRQLINQNQKITMKACTAQNKLSIEEKKVDELKHQLVEQKNLGRSTQEELNEERRKNIELEKKIYKLEIEKERFVDTIKREREKSQIEKAKSAKKDEALRSKDAQIASMKESIIEKEKQSEEVKLEVKKKLEKQRKKVTAYSIFSGIMIIISLASFLLHVLPSTSCKPESPPSPPDFINLSESPIFSINEM
ncbi:hypothetical protein L5515_018112 [Caenorhabditis briggsae]|uniref:Uncharacterized protein n=1 Tax=Caenorhabditis briggsae TaxID=6238 RepID=A0AAE9FGA4_CAEBR|nr:hypothetical protein L5515_018112 [Caenorhabditis briggsae]